MGDLAALGDHLDSSEEEEDASDDDPMGEEDDGRCFTLGMTREEKIKSRRPWRWSVIIKLIGRRIGYRYLSKRIQEMWKTQAPVIDLPNDFYIVKLSNKQERNRALLNGPWMIGDHYLHIQRWRPNFMADTEVINPLTVWVRFHVLPVQYYTIS